MKITISAPRGPQKALNMTRNLYVFVPGARKVLKSPKNLHFHENGGNLVKIIIFTKMVISVDILLKISKYRGGG